MYATVKLVHGETVGEVEFSTAEDQRNVLETVNGTEFKCRHGASIIQ